MLHLPNKDNSHKKCIRKQWQCLRPCSAGTRTCCILNLDWPLCPLCPPAVPLPAVLTVGVCNREHVNMNADSRITPPAHHTTKSQARVDRRGNPPMLQVTSRSFLLLR